MELTPERIAGLANECDRLEETYRGSGLEPWIAGMSIGTVRALLASHAREKRLREAAQSMIDAIGYQGECFVEKMFAAKEQLKAALEDTQ